MDETVSSAPASTPFNGYPEALQSRAVYGWRGPASALHPKQQRILALLEERPGVNIKEVANAIGVYRTAAIHHIRQLARENRVARVRSGRHVFHYLPTVDKVQRVALSLLRIASIRAVVQILFENPTVAWEDVASRVNLSARTVRRVIYLLERNGLAAIERRRTPALNHVHLHSDLRVIMARWTAPDATTAKAIPPLVHDNLWFVGWTSALARIFSGV